ncbi:DUF202 domain-containing protein [Sungkyunkwania multivorans]|uniref:DUF202 domain-containing protein n=1 Tax=Sungkyunkwania multivorans TaxID=1173618 RepID=A0ABW3CXE7_9FLAO
MIDNNDLITRDWLAIERTKLANERTFLAYLRTFIVLFASGVGILKIDLFSELKTLGLMLTILSPIIFIVGLLRLLRVRKRIRDHYS